MKSRLLFALLLVCFSFHMNAQDPSDYYYQIPDYPDKYTPGTVAARVVDGLGFRFYWATADLRPQDHSFKSNEDGRTIEETVDHIWGLTRIVMNATKKQPTEFKPGLLDGLSFEEKRNQILEFIKEASERLKKSKKKDFKEFQMIFKNQDGTSRTYPFWNELNGPLADALWHTGQVVLMRRGSGNPFNSKAGVLEGKVRK